MNIVMDNVNREDDILYERPLPAPPGLAGCMLDFGRVRRGEKKILQQVIANTTTQPMIWLGHTGEVKWITLQPDHGVLQPGEQQAIRVIVDTHALAVGEHCVTLVFSSEGDETSISRNMFSKVKVEEGSMSSASSSTPLLQTGLHLGWLTPQSTGTTGLVINNPSTSTVEWQIQVGSGAPQTGKRVHFDHLEQPADHWEDFTAGQQPGIIQLAPTNGSLGPGESATVHVTANADPAQLQSDYSYAVNLTLTSKVAGAAGATPTAMQVPVTFYVSMRPYDDWGPKIPVGLPPYPGTSITIPTGQQQAQAAWSFTNNEDKTVYWTLKPDAAIDWLDVNPSAGTLASQGQASVELTATRAKLQPGVHSTGLHLDLSYNAAMNPVNAIEHPIPVTVMVE